MVVIGAIIIVLGFVSTSRWAERSSADIGHLLREPANDVSVRQRGDAQH